MAVPKSRKSKSKKIYKLNYSLFKKNNFKLTNYSFKNVKFKYNAQINSIFF